MCIRDSGRGSRSRAPRAAGARRSPASRGAGRRTVRDMAEVLLFHHALGRTPGVVAFADELRLAGHTVHAPDLFDGRTFDTIDAGMAHVGEIGFREVIARGERAAEGLPSALVYAGFSLGVLPAQKLAQTRPGARGARLGELLRREHPERES